MKIFLLLTLALFSSLQAEDGLVVQLKTESALSPISIPPIEDRESGMDREYLKQLHQILAFDFSHNGATYLIKKSGDWRKNGARFAIEAEVKQKKLSVLIYSIEPEMAKRVENLELTGQLNVDRRTIHQLSDSIHQLLLGTPGVAGSKILYTVRHPLAGKIDEWESEVWEADYDGANARQITRQSHYAVTPSFIPPEKGKNPSHFLFVAYGTGQPKIYIGSLQDGKSQRLTYMRGNQLMPTLSSDRSLLAFISDITTNPDLFMQPFDPKTGPTGKPQQIFRAPMKTQGSPTFSPDGKRIAFVSNKGGNPQIYVMPVPEQGAKLKDVTARQLTRRNRESTAPRWSPDGSKLAYCALTGGTRQIWIYDFKKGEEQQLTEGALNKENPTWGADSLHLIYNSSDARNSELYLINLNQPEAVKISSGSGEKRFPAWAS